MNEMAYYWFIHENMLGLQKCTIVQVVSANQLILSDFEWWSVDCVNCLMLIVPKTTVNLIHSSQFVVQFFAVAIFKTSKQNDNIDKHINTERFQ